MNGLVPTRSFGLAPSTISPPPLSVPTQTIVTGGTLSTPPPGAASPVVLPAERRDLVAGVPAQARRALAIAARARYPAPTRRRAR